MQPKVSLQVGGGAEPLLTYVTLMGLLSYKHNIHTFCCIGEKYLGQFEVYILTSVDKLFQKLEN
jgi:hypothetical protein